MIALNLPTAGLQATAWSALLFTGTALLLALVVAVLLGVLDELALRGWVHRRAARRWLDAQLPSSGSGSRTIPKDASARSKRLLQAFSSTPMPEPAQLKETFLDIIDAAAGLPTQQMMGMLSSSVQAELGNRTPSPFICWLAAIGSLPIEPSPFDVLPEKPPADKESEPNAEAMAARAALQAYAEHALDGLQVSLLRMRTLSRHAFAAALVMGLIGLIAAQAQSETRVRQAEVKSAAAEVAASAASAAMRPASAGADSPVPQIFATPSATASSVSNGLPGNAPAHVGLSVLLYMALSAVSTAFVAVLTGPLERLTTPRGG